MNTKFEKKLVLITGGSEGIGLSVAKEMLKNGAHVVIAGRSAVKLKAAITLLEEFCVNGDPKLSSVTLDVTDFNECQKTIAGVVEKSGIPDYVINCAGFAHPAYLADLSVEDCRRMMETNFYGIFNVCKVIEPYFKKKGGGDLVNTSSMAGFLGLFGYTGYCATKFAVIGFSEALKRELKPYGIRVAVLCPPNTKTPGLENENRIKPAEVLATEEKAKTVEPDFVARALLVGLRKGKFLIIPTFDGKLAYLLNRYIPWVIEHFTKRP